MLDSLPKFLGAVFIVFESGLDHTVAVYCIGGISCNFLLNLGMKKPPFRYKRMVVSPYCYGVPE